MGHRYPELKHCKTSFQIEDVDLSDDDEACVHLSFVVSAQAGETQISARAHPRETALVRIRSPSQVQILRVTPPHGDLPAFDTR